MMTTARALLLAAAFGASLVAAACGSAGGSGSGGSGSGGSGGATAAPSADPAGTTRPIPSYKDDYGY